MTLKNLGLEELQDAKVLQLAITRDEILLTEDRGFENILDYPPQSHQGIIVLRIRTRSRKGLHHVLNQFLSMMNRDKLRWSLAVLDEKIARIKR